MNRNEKYSFCNQGVINLVREHNSHKTMKYKISTYSVLWGHSEGNEYFLRLCV